MQKWNVVDGLSTNFQRWPDDQTLNPQSKHQLSNFPLVLSHRPTRGWVNRDMSTFKLLLNIYFKSSTLKCQLTLIDLFILNVESCLRLSWWCQRFTKDIFLTVFQRRCGVNVDSPLQPQHWVVIEAKLVMSKFLLRSATASQLLFCSALGISGLDTGHVFIRIGNAHPIHPPRAGLTLLAALCRVKCGGPSL